MKRILLVLITVLPMMGILLSCDEHQNENVNGACFYYDYTAYVYSYTPAETMKLRPTIQIFEPEREIGEGLTSHHGFQVLFVTNDNWYDVDVTRDSNPTLYDSLCRKHNDLSYNRRIGHSSPNFPHNYLAFDLVAIHVTSSADFDAQHPAGTSLNDIVQFIAYTPYSFIQNGYPSSDTKQDRWWEELTLINKPLSQCTQEDFILTLGQRYNGVFFEIPCCYLDINALPTLSKHHTITVTVLDDAGKTWEASIDMDWSGQ